MIRALALMLTLSHAELATADTPYACPAELSVATSVTRVPEGWATLDSPEGKHRLISATFANGHPKGLGYLRPSGNATTPGKRREVYRFPAKYPNGVWLVCLYRDTSAILFKRLTDVPQTCEVSYAGTASSLSVETISCQ